MRIDAHTHFIPQKYFDEVQRHEGLLSYEIENGGSDKPLVRIGKFHFFASREHRDPEAQVRRMEEKGIDLQVISTHTYLYHYADPPDVALELARIVNEELAGVVLAYPGRFAAKGTVPLQDPEAACGELHRARGELGIRAFEIGSSVDGIPLDHPSLRSFFAEAEKLEVFISVHPYSGWLLAQDYLEFAYLKNLTGIPMNTAWAIGRLIFSGILEEFPRLKLGFSHGGGVAPFLLGRWDHGWEERPECRGRLSIPPSEAFRRLYFDTITHDPHALELVLSWVPPSHLLLGSDYPFDMGPSDPAEAVESARGLSLEDQEGIFCGNAKEVLGL